MPATQPNPEAVLRRANRRLAELLHSEPLDLATGGAKSMEDRLWVWGLLGGKEVGKSTLVNALAGAEVVDCREEVGEGTFQPAAYLTAQDTEALEARFADLGPGSRGDAGRTAVPVTYHCKAPDDMRGLVLVDLPDFDSLFDHHVEQVRRIATVLDGIIWVTTPKKIGDLRAIEEIRRVLKARCNFVYVVNKIDWLLAQSDPDRCSPQAELERVSAALDAQIGESDRSAEDGRSFVISAKYRSSQAMLDTIARSRDLPDGAALRDANGTMTEAVATALDSFDSLRQRLTTAPTVQEIQAGKLANLTHQARVQARAMLEHYRVETVLDRLSRIAAPGRIDEIVERVLPLTYCDRLIRRLNPDKVLFAEWSSALFRRRIAHWPVLGIIAWPVASLASLLGGLRSWLGGSSAADGPASFDFDGVSLEERVEGAVTGVAVQLAGIRQLEVELPSTAPLAHQFRNEAISLAQEYRWALVGPLLETKPGVLGKLLRWVVPLAVLIWFPVAQPVLAGLLPALGGEIGLNLELLTFLVQTLSAGAVLTGLAVSLLLLACLVAAVYSRAVRDTVALLDRRQEAWSELGPEPLTASLSRALSKPIEQIRDQLAELVRTLSRLADGKQSPPSQSVIDPAK